MKHPWRLFVARAGPARAKNGPALFQYFGLHEEVAESRMQGICGRRGQNNFGVAGYLNHPAFAGAVGERDSPQFNVVLRRDRNLRVGLQISLTAAELDLGFRKNGLIRFQRFHSWLICRRPELSCGNVADIAESPPGITSGVLTPPG